MIEKVIGSHAELGGWSNGLGPAAAPLLCDGEEITKTASSVPMPEDMEAFWQSYPQKNLKNYVFARINILGAGEYWGCFPAGSMVTTASGYKAIEEVSPGEMVLTHENRYRPVLAVQDRPHGDGLVTLNISGHPNLAPNIVSTPNHEFRIVRMEDLVCIRRSMVYKRDKQISLPESRATMMEHIQPEWVAAEDIQRGDYVMEPFPISEESILKEEWGAEAIATLAGWYAAEGCVIRRYDYEKHKERPDDLAGVVFVVSGPEEASIIEDAATRAGRSVHVTHDETLSRVELRWTDFARFCAEHIGTHAITKSLSQQIMTMPIAWQRAFFDSYAQGDGHRTKEGSIRVSSASHKLLNDMRLMIARFGWLGGVNGRHNADSSYYNGSPIFELHVGASNFSSGSNRNSEGYLHPKGFILSRVREVVLEEWMGTVFNLHVDEDNSYVVNGIAVHNSNLNGDYFPEKALKEYHKTFHRAMVYVNHDHDDPEKAIGKVIFSSYNDAPYAKRVELIVAIDKSNPRAQRTVEAIESGRGIKVSMGCFLAGTPITMADMTRIPIEQVKVGDEVISHAGNVRKVTAVHKRRYFGAVNEIRPEAHHTIRSTEEHPYWAMPRDVVKAGYRWKDLASVSADWIHSGCLTDEMLLEPVMTDVLTPDYVNRAFARLFGYYLAEGHVLRNKNNEIVGIEFSTHKDDVIHREISELCACFGTSNEPSWHDRVNSDSSAGIYVFDRHLAELCYEHGGSYAKKKKMSFDAMRWHPDYQREMLGAFANGDGCGTDKGELLLSTSSSNLAWQLMGLLPRIGIIASIQNLEHKAGSGFSTHATNEWVIHIGRQWAQGLRDVTDKVQEVSVVKPNCTRKIIDGYIVTPIRRIETIIMDTDVYNLEVEGDESYVAGGVAVHNCKVPYDRCSICNNIAATRKQYCSHLKHEMNRLYPDGKRSCAINDHPAFFDASDVVVEADPSSGFIGKVAARIAEVMKKSEAEAKKESTIVKPEAAEEKAKETDPAEVVVEANGDKLEQAGKAIADSDPAMPEDILETLSQFPMEKVMATTAGMQIPLKPVEITFISIRQAGSSPEARKAYRKGTQFADEQPGEEPAFDLFRDYDDKIEKLLLPLLSSRTMFPSMAVGRLTDNQEESPKKPTVEIKNASAGAKLAAYKRDVANMDADKLACLIHTKPAVLRRITGDYGSYLTKTASITDANINVLMSVRMIKGAYRA